MVAVSDYVPAPDEFASRVILVTGATQGIGRALATGLVRHGATVILHGRRAKTLDALYHELKIEECDGFILNQPVCHFAGVSTDARQLGREVDAMDQYLHDMAWTRRNSKSACTSLPVSSTV